jgi:hypothetical protein
MDEPAPPPGQVSLQDLVHLQVRAAERTLANMVAAAQMNPHPAVRCQAGCLAAKVALGKLLVVIRVFKTLDRLPHHLVDCTARFVAFLALFKPPDPIIPIPTFPRSFRARVSPVPITSPREFVGWRYLVAMGRLPAGSTFSITRNRFCVTAPSYSYQLDLFSVRLVGFRFVGDPTAFKREMFATYITKLNRAVKEDDWIELIDRILSTLVLTSRFFSIVKYLIPVAGQLGYSVDFRDAVLSLTFLEHPFLVCISSPHVRVSSRIPLEGQLFDAAIDKFTDAEIFALFANLQRLVCDRTPRPLPVAPEWPPPVSRPRVRDKLLELTGFALQTEQCGFECVIWTDRLRFILPWIGAAVLRMRDNLTWSLNVPPLARRAKPPIAVKFRGRRVCLNFPAHFTRFIGRLMIVWQMEQNIQVCRTASLRVKTDFDKNIEMRVYARFGKKDRTLIGRLAFTEAGETHSTFVVVAPWPRCFPRVEAWRTGDPLLRPLLRQLFEGWSPIETSLILEVAAAAPLLIAISREVPDPIWTVVPGHRPLHFFAIMHQELVLSFCVNLASRFVLITSNAPQYQLVQIVMRATNLLRYREFERMFVCDNMRTPQFLTLVHGCHTVLRELAVTDQCGWKAWTFVPGKFVVAVQCDLRRLAVVAQIGIHGMTLVAFGTGPTAVLLRRYLALHADRFGCNGQCLDFVIQLAAASKDQRRAILHRELPGSEPKPRGSD